MIKKLLIIALMVGALFGAKMEISKDATCLIRNIKVYQAPEWAATIQVRSGEVIYFSSPKSMFEFYFEPSHWPEYQVKQNDDMRINVTDYETLEKIPAREAFYVYGSQKTSPAGDDLPAFANKEKAEKFAKQYQGRRVLDFSQVSNGLINLLNDKLR
ncbi:nitrous oxide reductase accessory protein NosL [Sulfurospirillum arsenophilum]|uniref:nitrous oxide reductase accessory protein NosL n=1 Tax=Sulfurospirillum arsenophilum TaxID=56698 RepID=UPI0005A5E5A1|nr:nitrous oxide reductase accessory protein NosL [Sulfurospirillum arsenophilum]